MARNAIFFPDNVPAIPGVLSGLLKRLYPTVAPTRLVVAAEAFTLGGTRFEVLPLPGAEGSDGLALWLPKEEILFVGDFFGASFPMWPNLTTMRGERARFPKPYLDSLDRVLVLDPRILVPSHFEPITDREAIREGVQRTRDAVAYVEQAVIDGMNDGKDVYTLMREITLPPDLALPEVHGKVAGGVRSIWEAYSGWFHLRSTTELYAVPASAIYPEIAEAIGGPGSAIARAKRHLASGEPVRALHWIEIAASASASAEDPDVLRARQETLAALRARSGGVNHFETMWLDYRIKATREALGD